MAKKSGVLSFLSSIMLVEIMETKFITKKRKAGLVISRHYLFPFVFNFITHFFSFRRPPPLTPNRVCTHTEPERARERNQKNKRSKKKEASE